MAWVDWDIPFARPLSTVTEESTETITRAKIAIATTSSITVKPSSRQVRAKDFDALAGRSSR
jgi:hypothetical protein